MRSIKALRIAAALCLLLTCAAAAAPGRGKGQSPARSAAVITVEAEGRAAYSGDRIAARNSSYNDLQRNAVIKAVGVSIETETLTEAFVVTVDRVYSQLKGIVTGVEISSEGPSGDEYRILARCTVSTGALDGRLGPAVIRQLGNPKILIRSRGLLDGRAVAGDGAANVLSQAFQQAGYQMLDERQTSALRQDARDDLLLDAALAPKDRSDDLRSRGLQDIRGVDELTRPDIIVDMDMTSTCYARNRFEGMTFYYVQSEVILRATSSKNGNVIYDSHSICNANAANLQSAADQAMKDVASEAAKDMTYRMAYTLINGREGGLAGSSVSLVIQDIPFGKIRTVREHLEKLPGVHAVNQHGFSRKTLILDVSLEGTAEDLANALNDLGVEIDSLGQDSLKGIWKKGQ